MLFTLVANYTLLAQDTKKENIKYPVPLGNTKQLFYLQRTENMNTLIYELNEANGVLDTENPIHIFWILYAKEKQHEELSEMEKKFAYGIKIKLAVNESYQFTLVAYSKINLQLKKGADEKYHVYVTPTKQQLILNKVYIQVKEGGFKIEPDVEYIEFTGTDAVNGKETTERVIP